MRTCALCCSTKLSPRCSSPVDAKGREALRQAMMVLFDSNGFVDDSRAHIRAPWIVSHSTRSQRTPVALTFREAPSRPRLRILFRNFFEFI
jgi:hypothetical protein